jgi:sugar O-acyltransferase (sialic acid O-acetyltransferase NeuD family)
MTCEPLLLIGAGGHAVSCIDVIEQQGKYSIMGLVGRPHEVGSTLLSYSVIGCDDDLPDLTRVCKFALITVGHIKSPTLRIKLFEDAMSIGFKFPSIISPHAYVSPHAKLGSGTIVMHGAIINADTVVGHNCIINSNALVEHGVKIADHCHISTASVVNGNVSIGQGTFLGSGSCVRESRIIGEHCLIGMKQSVHMDCKTYTQLPKLREKV